MTSFEYPVRLEDLDYMGIVGHDQWLKFLFRARIDLLEKLGYPFRRLLAEKVGAVVARAEIDYLRPAVYDDRLTVNVRPVEPFDKGTFLDYEVRNQHGKSCLRARFKMVFVGGDGRPVEPPAQLRSALEDVK